ncbi:MAG: MBOAT family protein [Lachnospiraceae bacterium]|nr:MBOAT family protein [Lachnospiraceae bacterium]
MVFSSVIFLCFFLPAVLAVYFVLPKKARNFWLLVASLAFYACGGPKHLIYLIASIVINFLFGIAIANLSDKTHPADERGQSTYHKPAQKAVLAIAVILNIGSLIYFKYTGMIVDAFNSLSHKDVSIPEIILPLGISFYTFQCMSYIIDVYRTEGAVLPDGRINSLCTRDPLKFALFVTMFPQLLQGPIIRYSDVRDALDTPVITLDSFSKGVERFIIGLAKKAVIANTIGEVCDRIFAIDPANMSASVAWLGAVMYTLQIYFDFSGYTDMAIGLGKLFGFTFRENFNYPYISRSVTEFWRRWHISLSNWFRDYLYIPLGGNRRGNVYVNLLIVFLATGLWHGAAFGFLVWGLWHGLFMLIERSLKGRNILRGIPSYVRSFLGWLYTIVAVTLGWVLFRIEDLPKALSYISAMFAQQAKSFNAYSVRFFLDARMAFFLLVAILACVPWASILPQKAGSYIAMFAQSDRRLPRVSRHVILLVLFVICFVFTVNTTYSPFIYFRF